MSDGCGDLTVSRGDLTHRRAGMTDGRDGRTDGRIRADALRATESLYGSTRSGRPSDLHGSAVVCPFCPGSEALTGALMTPDPGPAWESRVIANLYPSVIEPDGRHEVIVDVREHTARWTELSAATIERILKVYRSREAAGFADGYEFVATFKNSGAAAGASLRHPHTQVVALRRTPLSVATRLERLTPECGTCAVIADDQGVIVAPAVDWCIEASAGDGTVAVLAGGQVARASGSEQVAFPPAGAAVCADPVGDRIVARTPGFTAYIPDGSRSAFEVRIAPAVHAARFSQAADAALPGLAAILRDVLERLAATLGEDPPFNVIVQSAPRNARAEALAHWEIELVPRLENIGGYELGTGGFLVSRMPEAAAAILRAARPAAKHA